MNLIPEIQTLLSQYQEIQEKIKEISCLTKQKEEFVSATSVISVKIYQIIKEKKLFQPKFKVGNIVYTPLSRKFRKFNFEIIQCKYYPELEQLSLLKENFEPYFYLLDVVDDPNLLDDLNDFELDSFLNEGCDSEDLELVDEKQIKYGIGASEW
jgi:hypothetical protein